MTVSKAEREMEKDIQKVKKRKYQKSKIERMYNYLYKDPVKPIRFAKVVLMLRCPECGYEWSPKVGLPKTCPNCSIRFEDTVKVVYSPEISKELNERLKEAEAVLNEIKEIEVKVLESLARFIRALYPDYWDLDELKRALYGELERYRSYEILRKIAEAFGYELMHTKGRGIERLAFVKGDKIFVIDERKIHSESLWGEKSYGREEEDEW